MARAKRIAFVRSSSVIGSISSMRIGRKVDVRAARAVRRRCHARAAIAAMPLTTRVANARLSASIQQIEKPLRATQVTLAIEFEQDGQKIQPSVLTFWVPALVEGSP